jgi:hypothetical protein
MLTEYFKIIHTFHTHRNNPNIRAASKLQLEMLRDRCGPRLFQAVNLFLLQNFSGPESMTG